MTIKIVERRNVTRDYGFSGVDAIIDHPKHGRMYISDAYGGEGTLAGGCVRWQHGLVIKLRDGDTFAALEAAKWNEVNTLWDAIKAGYDDSRPILLWDGGAVEKVATAAGL